MKTLARKLAVTVRPAIPEDADFIIQQRKNYFERAGIPYFPALPDVRWWIADFDGHKVGCMGLLLLPGSNEILGMDLYRAEGHTGLAALRAMRDTALSLAEYMEADLTVQVPSTNARMCKALEKAGFEPRAIVYRRKRNRNI